MGQKLKDRIETYQNSADYKLLNKVPLVICLNGRGFSKLTSLIDKPYCPQFTEAMMASTIKLCAEVEGALFGYQCNDEILIIARNDQNESTEAWYDNKIQKICSITSSIATNSFKNYIQSKDLNLVGDPIFSSQIFVVPNVMEAINSIIYKQQQNFHTSIQFACFYELLKKYDKNSITNMLTGLSIDEKIDLLSQECDIDFNAYSHYFRRGAACYRIPKIIDGAMKNKWSVDVELPIFTKDQSFLNNIFKGI